MKYQIKKLCLQTQFLIPSLEGQILQDERILLQQYNRYIFLSCVGSFFSLVFSIQLNEFLMQQHSNNSLWLYNSIGALLICFSSCMSGLFVDVLGIHTSWSFFIGINSLSLIIFLIGINVNSYQIQTLSYFVSQNLLPICMVNFLYILYDSSYLLEIRFTNAIKFYIFGVTFPIWLIYLENYFSSLFPQQENFSKKFNIVSISVCLLINLTSLFALNKSYKVLAQKRTNSESYKIFLIYQGNCFSLLEIFRNLINFDFLLILIISSTFGAQNISTSLIQISSQISNLTTIIFLPIFTFSAYYFIKKSISSKRKVASSYKYILFLLYFEMAIILIEFALFLTSVTQKNHSLVLIINDTIPLMQNCAFLIAYSITHQIIIILLPERCSIRGIALSLTFVAYYGTTFIYTIVTNYYLFYSLQLVQYTFALIVTIYYLRKRSFAEIDEEIEKQS